MSVMRRKRTGGKSSAYRREKAIMTASVVLVTGGDDSDGHFCVPQSSEKPGRRTAYCRFLQIGEGDAKSGVNRHKNPSAQNVTGSDKDSGELDYDPYYAQKDKDLSAPAKTGGESDAGAAGEQETGRVSDGGA